MLLIAMLLAFLVVRRVVLDQRALAPYESIVTDPRLSRPVQLLRFPLHRQAHAYSCGPATISMVVSYLEAPISEEEYSSRAGLSQRKKGMLPRVFLHYLQRALPSRRVQLVSDHPRPNVLRLLHSQLARGTPVPVYFSTADPPGTSTSDTHYSVVTGMDLARGIIHVADARGFENDLELSDFFAGLSFDNHRTEPFGHVLARLTGYIAKNNVYMISPAVPESPTAEAAEGPDNNQYLDSSVKSGAKIRP